MFVDYFYRRGYFPDELMDHLVLPKLDFLLKQEDVAFFLFDGGLLLIQKFLVKFTAPADVLHQEIDFGCYFQAVMIREVWIADVDVFQLLYTLNLDYI